MWETLIPMQPSPAAETLGLGLLVSDSASCLLSIVYVHTVVGEKQTEDVLDTTVSLGSATRFSFAESSLYTVDGRRCLAASRSILSVNWINWMVGLTASILHLFSLGRSLILAKPILS